MTIHVTARLIKYPFLPKNRVLTQDILCDLTPKKHLPRNNINSSSSLPLTLISDRTFQIKKWLYCAYICFRRTKKIWYLCPIVLKKYISIAGNVLVTVDTNNEKYSSSRKDKRYNKKAEKGFLPKS